MQQLIEKIKKRKIFSLMSIIVLISITLGILFISLLSKENKELIITSVTNFLDAIKENKLDYNNILLRSLTNNLLLNVIIWLLGISIVGIPIVLSILFIKSFVVSFTFTSILYTYKFKGLIIATIYILPHLLNLFITYILTYYSMSFSIALFNYLFRKKECNRKVLVTRYLKLLVIFTIFFIMTSLMETYIIPLIIRVINL